MAEIDLLKKEKEAFINYYNEIKYDTKITQCFKNSIQDKILILEVKIWRLENDNSKKD